MLRRYDTGCKMIVQLNKSGFVSEGPRYAGRNGRDVIS